MTNAYGIWNDDWNWEQHSGQYRFMALTSANFAASLAVIMKRPHSPERNPPDGPIPMGRVKSADVVRGQYDGYRKEKDVARNSDVETFCALRLFIDSWRWEGVPWYVRSGKYLAASATEVVVELKPPPQSLFSDSEPGIGRANYLRFRLSPDSAIALAARVKIAGKDLVGERRELYLSEERRGQEAPYERLLGAAMSGDGALFTREDAVESAWAVVDPVLKNHHRAYRYKRCSWGPKEAAAILASGETLHNPKSKEACD